MIHPSVQIHPSSIIEGDVFIGEGTEIGPFCYFRGPLRIGAHNRFSSHVCIGQEAEHRRKESRGTIVIGDHNVIRELVVIHRGTGERDTEIHDNCYLMDHVHVSHDCLIESDVTISHNTVLAGFTIVQKGATLGILCSVHQHSTIGAYSMCGMGSVVTKDVPPFVLINGNPARMRRFNTHRFGELSLPEDSLLVEDGTLKARHPMTKRYIERFLDASRRKKLLECCQA